jgi:adenosylhomocysteine nucleosidase
MAAKRVAMLAPMVHELAPLVRDLGLVETDGVHRGVRDGVEVVALLTTMGMAPAEHATEQALALDVDRVIVVGIAGGVDPATLGIGELLVPERVIDRRTGRSYGPPAAGDIAPRGVISCGDDLITDPDALAAMGSEGVVAVDMETAAVAAVCEAAGRPWSAYRSISDYAGEGLVDDELFALTTPDGGADHDALNRYLAEHPEKIAVLERLAADMTVATEAAAAAAIASLTTV